LIATAKFLVWVGCRKFFLRGCGGEGGAKRVIDCWSKKPGALLAAAIDGDAGAHVAVRLLPNPRRLFHRAPLLPSEDNPFIPTGAIPAPSETAPMERIHHGG
jgi:hypothetical protein